MGADLWRERLKAMRVAFGSPDSASLKGCLPEWLDDHFSSR
jgi:hypothetical protein